MLAKVSLHFVIHSMSKNSKSLNRSRNPMDFSFDDVEPLLDL